MESLYGECAMPPYNEEFKEGVLRKLLGPNPPTIASVSRETGVSRPTLRSWLRALDAGVPKPAASLDGTARERARREALVRDCEGLSGEALANFCRSSGVYVEQVEEWRAALAGRLAPVSPDAGKEKELREMRRRLREQDQVIAELRRDLARKDRALAEAAALAVLEKKSILFLGGRRAD